MKDKCKQYTASVVMKGNDGIEHATQIINCSECPEHFKCEGKEKHFSIIVDKEVAGD